MSLEELIARSDVISLNCPLTEETRHLLTEKEFAKMKDGVCIGPSPWPHLSRKSRTRTLTWSAPTFDLTSPPVNTSRGAVIKEEDLVAALESGKVLRAALDVFGPSSPSLARTAFFASDVLFDLTLRSEEEPKIHPGLISSNKTVSLPPPALVSHRTPGTDILSLPP